MRFSILRIQVVACVVAGSGAVFAMDDATYNLPPAVTGTIGADAGMTKMETPVKPDILEAFKKQHRGKFWLFGEDRQFAVRKNFIPAHWFEDGRPSSPC